MGTVYIKQDYERIILREYDDRVSDILNEWVRDRLIDEGLLDEDDAGTTAGRAPNTDTDTESDT